MSIVSSLVRYVDFIVSNESVTLTVSAGPYFPRKGMKLLQTKSSLRPPKPVFQMHFHPKMLEANLGIDQEYDNSIKEFFTPYYNFILNICRTAIRNNLVSQEVVGLCKSFVCTSKPSLILFCNFQVPWLPWKAFRCE